MDTTNDHHLKTETCNICIQHSEEGNSESFMLALHHKQERCAIAKMTARCTL